MITIRTSFKKLLPEITRYEKEMGKKYSPKEEFSSRISDHPVEFAFTMTSIPKIGLNPKTKYNTPAGVYFYPLTQDYYEMLIENQLPFVSNSPYCGLVKLNWSDKSKWLIFSDTGEVGVQTKEALNKAREILTNKLGDPEEFRKLEQEAKERGLHYEGFGNDGKIFDLTYFVSRDLARKTNTRPTIAWTEVLRELGYIGVYDYGAGVIHSSERTQLVCLDNTAYQKINVYSTKDIRRDTAYEKGEIQYRIENAELIKKRKEFWKKFVSLPKGHPEKVYDHHQTEYGGLFTPFLDLGILGYPISILEGGKIIGNVYFGADSVIPDDLTVEGGINAENSVGIGKNITCTGKLMVALLDSLPSGLNLNVGTLKVGGSKIKSIPNDIQMKNLDVSLSFVEELPENLTLEGTLKIADSQIKKLPRGLNVKEILLGDQFSKFTKEEMREEEIIPQDLEVSDYIYGNFSFSQEGVVTADSLLKTIYGNSSTQEIYKKWRKFFKQ